MRSSPASPSPARRAVSSAAREALTRLRASRRKAAPALVKLMSTSCGVGGVPGRGRDVTRLWLAPHQANDWPRPKPLGVLWQIAAIATWSSIPVLGCIDAPTRVVCSDYDRAVPPANSRLLAARIRNARLITVQAGHDLQKPEKAAIVAGLVQKFLDSENVDDGLTRPVEDDPNPNPDTNCGRSRWANPGATNAAATRMRAVI
jgi:pimeloyl-ACP methyl ester carboxylesterase